MKTIRFHEFGGPEVLKFEELPDPTPGAGEVLVRVEAIGVNYTDVVLRAGELGPLTAPEYFGEPPELPTTPGFEGSGIVRTTGDGVSGLTPGDRVAFDLVPSAYSELVVAPAENLMPLPDGVSFNIGAALPMQGLTAYYLLFRTHRLRTGHTVLVHAGAGGVGLMAVQLAKRAGAKVIATVSSDTKAELVAAAGADETIRYDELDFVDEVMRFTGGKGADLVLDGVGRTTFADSLRAAAFHGHVITYGWPSGLPDPIQPLDLMPRALSLSGGNLIRAFEPTERATAFAEICDLYQEGALTVEIGTVLSLADAATAHNLLETRASAGKLLLTP